MPTTPFEYFVARNNARMTQLLERNHDFSAALMGIIESAVAYCDQKGQPFERLKMRDAHVIPTADGDSKVLITFTFV